MSNTFEVEAIDRLGVRATVMGSSKGKIEFPQRVSTSTDIWHAEKVMKEDEKAIVEIPSNVYEIKRKYSQVELDAFLNSPKELAKESRIVRALAKKRQNCLTFFNPYIGQKTLIGEKQHGALLKIQELAEIPTRTSFDSPLLSLSQLKDRINETKKSKHPIIYTSPKNQDSNQNGLNLSTKLPSRTGKPFYSALSLC